MNAITKWLVAAILLAGLVVANAALIAVDGGLLVNDPDANLTWVSDANLMATQVDASGNAAAFVETIINDSGGTITSAQGTHTLSINDFATTNGPNTSKGQMTWYAAQAWVHYLNVTNYRGYSNWRLPRTVDNNSSIIGFGGGSGNPSTSSEMAHLFYGELGQALQQSITTTHNGNYALFNNVQSFAYCLALNTDSIRAPRGRTMPTRDFRATAIRTIWNMLWLCGTDRSRRWPHC